VCAYSTAPEAIKKRLIDQKISNDPAFKGTFLTMWHEGYLKELINLASEGKVTVKPLAVGLQFFIIKGGAEGFLDSYYSGKDASRVVVGDTVTTSRKAGTVMTFVDHDFLIVFTAAGALIGNAILRRPISIAHPNIWHEYTANRVYNAWDGRAVSIYRNTRFDVAYYGLWVDDKLGLYRSGAVRIDMHKEEATNGCIFIQDPRTPEYDAAHLDKLSEFEPKLIRDIQEAAGAKVKLHIGTMRLITMR
jgi:hypothetical protein